MFAFAASDGIARLVGAEVAGVFEAQGVVSRWWSTRIGGAGAAVEAVDRCGT
jgi:hypothetical protein